ncbi:PepSY domain-containing protein [Streptomyces sp. NPDC007088]|uniref:PepSY domain-containing protein n=1 Tax=Streptomyces sp. NPDC007088 TaxID=3364773 RepID=UPI0036AC84D8
MKRNIVIATVTAGVLLAGGGVAAATLGSDSGGTGGGTPGGTAARTAGQDEHSDAAEHRAEARAAKRLSAPQAIGAALDRVPGRATSAELDDDDRRGALVWEVDVLDRHGVAYHVDVDPATGKALTAHRDRDDDAAADAKEDGRALAGTTTSASEAARAAADKGRVVSVDLDDDGGAHWSVEVSDGHGTEWSVPLDGLRVTPDRSDD